MRELEVVSKSKKLVKKIYVMCNRLPSEEKYGLYSQMTRAVVSIPSNIVEGQQRSDKDFRRFITIARGSLNELKIQCDIIDDIYNIKDEEVYELIDEIGRMTYSLMLKL